MKTTATLAALAALALSAHAVETTFGISTNAIGSSLDSDFHITETDKDTLVDGATFTVGSMSNTNNDLRAYLGFDLTGLTANGTVTNATLRLFRDVVPGSGFANKDAYGNADVYARTAAFVAGAGGGATDYDELTGTLLGTISTGDLATAQYFELDVTAIVESWRTNNLTNHFGFAMQGLETYTETGKQFQSRTGSNAPQLVVTQVDTSNPTIATRNPADDATVEGGSGNLVVTFSEDIAIGTGDITIKNLTDASQTTIPITSGSPEITVSGPTLTINPSADLLIGKDYAIQIAATAIKDLADNPFAGISDDTTWNFATVAPIPPAIVTLNPTDDATSVGTTSNLVVTFSEDIAIGTGDITIKNLTDTTQTTIDITSGSPQITVSGATLTINPPSNLAGGRDYAIQIAATAIKDLTNTPFAGISDDTTWTFTTLNQNIFAAADDAHMSQLGGITTTNSTLLQAGSDNTNPTFTEFDQYRGYLDFDMTGLTASGTVTNATVYLYFDPDGDTDYGISTLQALSAAYTVGSSPFTALAGTAITDPGGGLITAGTLHTFNPPILAGTAGWKAIDVTSVVEGWRASNLATEFGFSIVGTEGNYGNALQKFRSQDYADASFRPYLVVTQNSGTSDTFADWIDDPAFGLAPADRDLNDDPDGDGNDNGLENYFGTNPGVFSQGVVAGAVDTGANTFTFTHPINATPASDLTAVYRWSTDLQTFYDDGASNGAATTTVTFAQGAPSGGMVTVTATITGSVIPTKLFVDVKVTQP